MDEINFKSKWLKFIDYTTFKKTKKGKITSFPKTNTYMVRNKDNDVMLGWIKWYGSFRQYSFFPEPETVFERTCIGDIHRFITELMEERKIKKSNEKV